MKLSRLEKLYAWLLAVIFGGIVIHAPLSVYLGTILPKYNLLVKSWKEILLAIALVLMIVIVSRRQMWRTLWQDWLLRLITAFGALHLVLIALLYQGMSATAAGLAIDLRYFAYFALVYVLMVIASQWRRPMIWIGGIGAAIVVGFATLQLVLPKDILSHIGYGDSTIQPYLTVDKNPRYIRENSTLRGPNPLGAYAGAALAFLAALLIRRQNVFRTQRSRFAAMVFAVCSIVGVWVSYSRSALVAAIVAVVVVIGTACMRKITPKMWAVIGAIILLAGGGLMAFKGSSFVSNVLLHENPNGGSTVSSNANHVSSLETGWRQLLKQPLGAGVGSTGSASLFAKNPEVIEDQYLFVAHESGWLGLGLFVAIFALLLVRLWQQRADWLALGVFASGIGLATIGLLLPVWVDDTVSIVWWGFAAIAVGGEYAKHASKQKTARTI